MKKLLKQILDYLNYGKKKYGLTNATDDRNFGSHTIYKPSKEDLVEATKETFVVFNPKKVDQLDNDFCIGEGGAYEADATEDFDGASEQGSGAYVFAGAKKWSRANYLSFGTSLLAGGMARVKYGICDRELWNYKRGKRNYFANWNNIPQEAHDNAANHKACVLYELSIPWKWTKFNAIVSTLYHFRDEKVLIGTGNNIHRITVIGYDKRRDSLICVDTYGERTYEKGIRYVGRDEARTLFTSYFVIDLTRELAELLVAYDSKTIKIKDNNDCYLVKNGHKHLLPDEKIAWSHGCLLAPYNGDKLVEVMEEKEFDNIPTGDDMIFEGGKNEWIIRRIIEKYKIE